MVKIFISVVYLILVAFVIFVIVRGRKNVKKLHERFEHDVAMQEAAAKLAKEEKNK